MDEDSTLICIHICPFNYACRSKNFAHLCKQPCVRQDCYMFQTREMYDAYSLLISLYTRGNSSAEIIVSSL